MDNAVKIAPLSWGEVDVLRDLMLFDDVIKRASYYKPIQSDIDRLIERGLVFERNGTLLLNVEGLDG